MGFVELINSLETIAGQHGIGRIDMVENRTGGAKSREIYEAPAAVVLHTAHRELQAFVIPRDLERITSELGVWYADLVYKGLWYTQTRQAIDALVGHVQERVTGVIRMRFFKGEARVIGRQSPFGDSVQMKK
jgi:argininosuccinate synthase